MAQEAKKNKIAIGNDHAGYPAKEAIMQYLTSLGYEVFNKGCDSIGSCDYPDYAFEACQMVEDGEADRAILICGNGIGMGIAANKCFEHCFAAVVYDEITAAETSRHHGSNVLCLGARNKFTVDDLVLFINTWLETKFEGGRHADRMQKIKNAW
jgi:ribose 5-phosphate isomerase B